ncbi:heme biosynthesis protein HemY [Oryzicola mucosus]|uniref:Heme biosynthesis protein HemY n=1 Tax=Oryzicola mucosus TaxID=2767425 RepID=A0A8J6PI50_9HYPH|nr:heme biosynthesis protein HemY [Oryzicola mucosus]MBD0413946.1 heme biosynthesis protein HemY [Oryzicola mucosus]
MIRVLFYLAIVFALGLGFAWLADRPGDMVVTFDGYRYHVSLMVAAVIVTAIVAGVMLTWWLLKAIWNSPYTLSRHFRVRRRDRGYQALSTGMIAAGAGDAVLARKKNKEAAKLIPSDQEPLIALLDAQTSLLEGDHDTARRKFEAMLDDPEMRLLGLRGLYLEAERLGDRNAARHYAGRAADLAPQLAWAAESTIEELTARSDWDGALTLVDAQKNTGQLDKPTANNRRAVLLTAKAMALLDGNPSAARTAALEANKLRPNFVPAAVVAAKAHFRLNDIRKGAKLLEAAWKAEAHPEIADLYVHARPGDAVLDRLTRARKLKAQRQNHPESSLIVARAALEAQDYATARAEAEAAIRMQPREGAFLLLADIEEAETGDQGRARYWLGRAVRAPQDPTWVADGVASEQWQPTSPVTGRLDAFEWRAPVERLGQVIDDGDVIEAAPALAAPMPTAEPAAPMGETVEPVSDALPDPVEAVKPAEETPPPLVVSPPHKLSPVPVAEAEPAHNARSPASVAGNVVTLAAVAPAVQSEPRIEEEAAALPPLPDDPGVDPDEAAEQAPSRFRLF